MQTQVTAKVRHLVNLRNERIKPNLVEYLPGSFQELNHLKQPVQFNFFDNNGNVAESFPIANEKVFDLSNDIDRRNWEILKIFIAYNPDYAARIELNNPNEEAERQIKLDQLTYEIQSELIKIKNDSAAMAKIFRRVVGMISGRTETQMYAALWEASKTQQSKFQINGKSIFEDPELELYALVDLLIEKRTVLQDSTDSSLRLKNRKLIANNIDDLVFALKNDPAMKADLEVMSRELPIQQSDVYKLEIDTAGLAKSMDQYGEVLPELSLNADLSVNTQELEDAFDLELDRNIEILIERNFIVSNKSKKKFSFPTLPGHEFKREELAAHFKNNRAHYEGLKQQAELK